VFTDKARFPKGVPKGVSTVSTLRADLKPLVQAGAVAAEMQDAWSRIITAARTDRASRKAHVAALRERHGREGRTIVSLGFASNKPKFTEAHSLKGNHRCYRPKTVGVRAVAA
jgi:hypothetical protein